MNPTPQSFEEGLKSVIAIISLLNGNLNKRVLLAIAGGSCSGKTTFVEQIKLLLERIGINISDLGLDDYYKGVSNPGFPHDIDGKPIFDLPESYHINEFRSDINTLLSGKNIYSPIYDKKTLSRLTNGGRLVKAERVVMAEGLFAISALSDLGDDVVKIFIDADGHVRIGRRIIRDTVSLHNGVVEETLEFIRKRVEPYYQKCVLPQKELADIVIDGN